MNPLAMNEKGSVVVIVVLAIVVILGFSALAVDGGYLYLRHTQLQDIADSTALAAAMEMVETSGSETNKKKAAFDKAVDYAIKNKLEIITQKPADFEATVRYGNNETGLMKIYLKTDKPDGVTEAKVDIQIDAKLFLARVLGFNKTSVDVTAIAREGQATEQTGRLMPLSFFWDSYEINKLYDISFGPGEAKQGNFGYLDFDSGNLEDNLTYGYNGTLSIGQKIYSNPGADSGPVRTAIKSRVDKCLAEHTSPVCTFENVKLNHPDCPRLVIIPIIKGFLTDSEKNGGKMYVLINGFAEFFIVGYDDTTKILSGYFLEALSASEVSGSTSDFMMQAVHLVQ